MKIVSIIVLLASNVVFAKSLQVALPNTASNIKLDEARYEVVATKTAMQPIPGCTINDAVNTCDQTVVLETKEVINAYVTYNDSMSGGDGNQSSYATLSFEATDFSANDVALLKSVYPQWKHGFSSIPADFAREKLSLSTALVRKPIQIADMNRSRFCSVNGETGTQLDPNCVDQIVYKTSYTNVLEATVSQK